MNDIHRLQIVENNILSKFAAFCEEKKYKYYLAYGTLLGAVRHDGFIPWDDDVDVIMPRSEYDDLVESGISSIGQYNLISFRNGSNTHNYYLKLVDTTVSVISVDNKIQDAWIDIFPLDGMPDNKIEDWVHRKVLLILRDLINIKKLSDGYYFSGNNRPRHERIAIKVFGAFPVGKVINLRHLFNWMDTALKRYDASDTGICVCFMGEKFKDVCPTSYYGQGKPICFEGKLYNCPDKTDEILKLLYGKYMELPPVDERNVHSIKKVVYNGLY